MSLSHLITTSNIPVSSYESNYINACIAIKKQVFRKIVAVSCHATPSLSGDTRRYRMSYGASQSILPCIKWPQQKGCPKQVLVINRFFDLDSFYDMLKDSTNQRLSEMVLVIDTRDFLWESVSSFYDDPPSFAGISIDKSQIVLIESTISAPETQIPLLEVGRALSPESSELEVPEKALLIEVDESSAWVRDLLENKYVKQKLESGERLILRFFHDISHKDKEDVLAILNARFGAFTQELIHFHQGFLPTERIRFKEIMEGIQGRDLADQKQQLNPEDRQVKRRRRRITLPVLPGHKEAPKILIVNAQTICDFETALVVHKEGVYGINTGILDSNEMPGMQVHSTSVLVTEPLSDKQWLTVFNALDQARQKGTECQLHILEGISCPIEGTKRALRTSYKPSQNVTETDDVSYALATIDKSEAALIISVSPELTLAHLLGHLTIDSRKQHRASDPSQLSEFYKALREGRRIIFTHLDRNLALAKQLETVMSNSPYLYYLGTYHSFDPRNIKIQVINEKRKGIGSTTIAIKLAVLLREPEYAIYTPFKGLICRLLNGLVSDFSYVAQYSYIRKICRQIQVEKDWDKSSTLTEYHVRKAFSTLIKEFKLASYYPGIKKAVWAGFSEKKDLTQAQKDYRALLIDLLHNEQNIGQREGGWGLFIERYVSGDTDIEAIIAEFSRYTESSEDVATYIQHMSVEDRHDALMADQRNKDRRLRAKMQAHRLVVVLGPTGSGKTAAGLRIASDLNEGQDALFRVNVGPAVLPSDLVGGLATDSINKDRIVFTPGDLVQWATCSTGSPILLIDEATMIKDWSLLEQYLELGYFFFNGQKIRPSENAAIYMTGNESLNGTYRGRHLDPVIRQYAFISKKGPMSLEGLRTHIVEPLCGTCDANKISEYLLSILDIAKRVGIKETDFSTREVMDIVVTLNYRLDKQRSEIRSANDLEITLYDLSRATLMPLVDVSNAQALELALRSCLDHEPSYAPDISAQLLGREALIAQSTDRLKGVKPGVIINGKINGKDPLSLIDTEGKTVFTYQTGGQWEALKAVFKESYTQGTKLVVQNANLVPTHFWESLINLEMTEPKQGFMVFLLSSPECRADAWIAPSLRSRFFLINEQSNFTPKSTKTTSKKASVEPVTGPSFVVPIKDLCVNGRAGVSEPKRHNRKRNLLRRSWRALKYLVIVPKALLSLSLSPLIVIAMGISRGLDILRSKRIITLSAYNAKRDKKCYLDSKTHDQDISDEPQLYPNSFGDACYTRADIIHINYETMLPEERASELTEQSAATLTTEGNETFSQSIPLRFNKEGYAKIPSMSCYQEVIEYKTDNGSKLTFYKNEDDQFFVKLEQGQGKKPKNVRLKLKSPITSVANNDNVAPEMPVEFREKLKTVLEENDHKLANEIGIKQSDSRSLKIQKIDRFFKSWGHSNKFRSYFTSIVKSMRNLFIDRKTRNEQQVLTLLRNKKGVCRHRTLVASLLCDYYRIPNRIEASVTHTWVSVLNEKLEWEILEPHSLPNPQSTACNLQRVLPKILELPPVRQVGNMALDCLENIGMLNGTTLSERIMTKDQAQRSVRSGRIDTIALKRGDENPFKQRIIRPQSKCILTATPLLPLLKALFEKAGVEYKTFSDLTDVSLDEKQFEACQKEGMDDYCYLKESELADLVQQNLMTILRNVYSDLESRTSLDLSGNKLTVIPEEICQLTALTVLKLNDNQLQRLPDSIGRLTALETLRIDKNYLSRVPDSIGNLTALTELGINKNQLKEFPEVLCQLTALQRLGLFNNQLQTLPASIGKLTALQKLGLANNQLRTLPESICYLKALDHLGLADNQLQTLPDSICYLKALEYLDLSNNQLQTLPASIGKLTALQKLGLDNNQLRTLPDSICYLKALDHLGLDHNQLQTLPASIGNLTALQKLGLFNNQLRTLPDSICYLKALEYLDLSNNQLQRLPEEIERLTALQELVLDGNSKRFTRNDLPLALRSRYYSCELSVFY